MCLVCGVIGCFEQQTVSRNEEDVPFAISVEQSGHAVDHYEDTKHVYAQNIETQEVWDFNKVRHFLFIRQSWQ